MTLEALQREFTAHIRDPDGRPAPAGIEDRRMKIYRDLFFNNMQSLLAGNFPVIRRLYDEAAWQALVRDFYATHRCHTPLFPEIAREFLRYLQDGRGDVDTDPPFLLELAHYEWIELALDLDDRSPDDLAADPGGDLLDGVPVLSPLVHVMSYRYPVHRISPDYRPETPPGEPTHLLVYRNRDEQVKFMALNGVARLLVELLRKNSGETGRQLLQRIAGQIGHGDPDRVIAGGAQLLQDLRDRDILLGTGN